MLRAVSRRSEFAEEPEGDEGLELELARLQRQYRIMEGDRKAYCEESQNIVRKQRFAIEQLEKEKEEYETNLRLAESEQNEAQDHRNTQRLGSLLKDHDGYREAINAEKQVITEHDQQCRVMERKIAEQLKAMGGVDSHQGKHMVTQKRVRVLENRLDTATLNFNKMLTQNAELRAKIDHLLSERSHFDGMYKRLTRSLADGKKRLCEIVEQATQAYDQRDEGQSKMTALKERSEKDQTAYNVEMKELNRILDHDQKLKEFMTIKAQERADLLREAEESERKQKGFDDEKAQDKWQEETIQTYEQAFARIREVTGEDDIDTLVRRFIETEDQNFALFNYVNELNNEVELLQEQIHDVEGEMDQFHAAEASRQMGRQKELHELEEQLRQATSDADASEEKLRLCNKALDQLKAGVGVLFDKIGCDASGVAELLGGNRGITNNNIMLHLGIVEQRTSDLLRILHYLQHKKSEEDEDASVPSPLLPAPTVTKGNMVVLPPTTGTTADYSSGRRPVPTTRGPLTRGRLKHKTCAVSRGARRAT
ncbi:PREDICTED: coiled-coil domain-containing protein 63-like [Priapulus caudatus]|uniref:Coiled-coil domain-containing protein 63-like n=1 Tax=Priapulus caudatus TaxID=37621 RepID=A0ABM1E0S5_PRICU|nr:PREDICTED: coiled-coil domain-containing protein 63-like [Priapulus caudatus]